MSGRHKKGSAACCEETGETLQEQEDDNASMSDDVTANEPRKKGSICNVNITNFDLSQINNGFPNNQMSCIHSTTASQKEKSYRIGLLLGFANDGKCCQQSQGSIRIGTRWFF